MFLLWLRRLPDVGIRPLLQFPQLPRVGPILLVRMFFSLVPSFYQVLRGCVYIYTYMYIFFFTGQVLLSAIRWWFACTAVSESVFLMYLPMERDVSHVNLILRHLVLT